MNHLRDNVDKFSDKPSEKLKHSPHIYPSTSFKISNQILNHLEHSIIQIRAAVVVVVVVYLVDPVQFADNLERCQHPPRVTNIREFLWSA